MSVFNDFFVMDDSTLEASEEKTKAIIEEYERSDYGYTSFSFLNDHLSLRKGKRHLLIGTTGTGKTTLTRSVIFQLAKGARILWYSTEETLDDMIYMMTKASFDSEHRNKIHFRHETQASKWCDETGQDLGKYFSHEIAKTKCDVIVFDNLTTSKFYNKTPESDVKFFNSISESVKNLNIPIIIIAHTANGVKDMQAELFSGSDVRGNKIVSNSSEYIYAYQLITYIVNGQENKQGIIRTIKSRIGGASNSIYTLNYNAKENSYTSDQKVSFETFKNFYDKRVKLK